MLTCKVGENIIDTFSFKDEKLREWSNKGMLKCPVCNEKMIYCHGDFKIPYFRHEKNEDCLDIYSEGITEEHLKGTKIIYEWLKEQNDILNLQLEKWIPETRQRPDIYFEKYENNELKKYAIEYQCSPISTKYNERHDLYRLNNIKDVWILGKDKYDIGSKKWLSKINAKEIEVSRVKFKAIEKEIIDSKNNLIYLNSDSIYKIINIIDIGRKTIFNTIFDIISKINDDFEGILNCINLTMENPKYNIILDSLKEMVNVLNTKIKDNSGFKYDYFVENTDESMIFKVTKGTGAIDRKIILNSSYNNISENEINDLLIKENEIVNILKEKNKLFEENLEKEVDCFKKLIMNNGCCTLSEYCGIKQIDISIKGVKRIFKIHQKTFSITCNNWESHKRFEGISRKRKFKYSVGWHLNTIKTYEISESLDAKEVINIIKKYYKSILYSQYKIILEDLFLSQSELLKIKNIELSIKSIEREIKSILKRFGNIKKYFSCIVKKESIYISKIKIDGINNNIKLSFDMNFSNNYIQLLDDKIFVKSEIGSDNYIEEVVKIIDDSMSNSLRKNIYNNKEDK